MRAQHNSNACALRITIIGTSNCELPTVITIILDPLMRSCVGAQWFSEQLADLLICQPIDVCLNVQ